MVAEIPAAPLLLFVDGDLSVLSAPQIALVGTRNPNTRWASRGGHVDGTGCGGLVITSGLALGIDVTCHQMALQAQGRTLAVLGSGLTQCYPRRHLSLSREIVAQRGALVSELWPDILPCAENFPRRNRIISGLSLGTVVVIEAAAQADHVDYGALCWRQGREVFAVPRALQNPVAAGCLHLTLWGKTCLFCSRYSGRDSSAYG